MWLLQRETIVFLNVTTGDYNELLSGKFQLIRKNKYYSLTAAIPGNTFPSKYSSIAPPPVET